MSDNIEVGLNASGGDQVKALTSAIDALQSSIERLGAGPSVSALSKLETQMQQMQASITTGFAEIAAVAEAQNQRTVRSTKSMYDELTGTQTQYSIRVQLESAKMAQKQRETYEALWEGLLAGQDAQLNTMLADQAAYVEKANALHVSEAAQANAIRLASVMKDEEVAAARLAVEEERISKQAIADLEARAAYNTGQLESLMKDQEVALARTALEEERLAKIHALEVEERARHNVMMLESWSKDKELEEAALALHIKNAEAAAAATAASLEKQRLLNANFLASSPAAQLQTIKKGLTYSAQGGDASALVGSAAAAKANATSLAEVTAAQEKLAIATGRTTVAAGVQNEVFKEASGVFKGAAHELGVFGLVHGQIAAMLAGAGIVAGLHAIAVEGSNVEYSLKFMQSLSSGGQGVSLGDFLTVSQGSLVSLKEAAAGVRALAEAGLTANQALAVLPDTLKLATLGEMTVAQAAEMVVESMHAFGLSAGEAGRITDVLAKTAASSNISIHTLAEDMKSAATTGEMFHMTMEEVTATVAVLAERGLTIQPLSSALKSIYEPGTKAAAALKQLGISAQDGQGGLKNYTDILSELKVKMSTLNEAGVAAFTDALGGPRVTKALTAITNDFDKYKEKVAEAANSSGFAFQAVVSQADTVEGAFKVLASTAEGTINKAFQDASPLIRQVENDLTKLASDPGVLSFFTSLAEAAARLTSVIVENAGAIKTALEWYAGFRIFSTLSNLLAQYIVKLEAAAAAQAQAALQAKILGESTATAAVQIGAAATAEEAVAVASVTAGSALTTLATGARAAVTALGWIGVAIGAVTIAYELFRDNMSKEEEKRTTLNNSIQASVQQYDLEIARLEKLKDLREGKITEGPVGEQQYGMNKLVEQRAADIAKLKQLTTEYEKAQENAVKTVSTGFGTSDRDPFAAANASLAATLSNIRDLTIEIGKENEAIGNYQTRIETLTSKQAEQTSAAKLQDLRSKILQLSTQAGLDTGGGTAASRALAPRITDLQNTLITTANYNTVLEQQKKLQSDINSALNSFIPIDKKAATDRYNAAQKQLDLDLQLQKLQSRSAVAVATAQNRASELGDIQLINVKKQQAQLLDDQEIATATKKIALADTQEHKLAAQQALQNKIAVAKADSDLRETQAEADKNAILARYDSEMNTSKAATLKEQGKLVASFLADYEAKYSGTLAKIDKDIDESFANQDNETLQFLKRYKQYMQDMKDAGTQKASFDEIQTQIGQLTAAMTLGIEQVNAKAQEHGGLPAALGAAQLADDIKKKAAPAIEALIKQLEELADKSGNLALKKQADDLSKNFIKSLNEIQPAYKDFLKEVDTLGTTTFESLFSKTGTSFANTVKKMRDDFQKFLVDEIYKELARPFVLQLVATVGGSLGFSGLANAATTAAGGGSGIVSLLQTGSKLSNTFDTISNGFSTFGDSLATYTQTLINMSQGMSYTQASLSAQIGSGAGGFASGVGVAGQYAGGIAAGIYGGRAISGGMSIGPVGSNALVNIGTAIGAIWGPMGAAIGGAIAGLANRAFGMGEKSITGQTVTGSFGAGDAFSGSRNVNWTQPGGWFRGDRSGTWSYNLANSTAVADGVSYQDTASKDSDTALLGALQQAYQALKVSTAGYVTSLGLNADALKTMNADLSFSFGKDAAETQANITKAFSDIADKFAVALVPTVAQFSNVGETASQTLARLSSDFAGTNLVVQTLGKNVQTAFGAIGLASIQAREDLITLAGGLQQLQTATAYFAQNFLTPAEQVTPIIDDVNQKLAKLGVTGVTTADQFKQLVLAQDLSTAAGRQMYVALLAIAPEFKQIQDAMAATAKAALDAASASAEQALAVVNNAKEAADLSNQGQAALNKFFGTVANASTAQQEAAQASLAAAQAALSTWQSVASAIQSALDSISVQTAAETPTAYASTQAQFKSLLAAAQGGDAGAAGKLSTAAQNFLTASQQQSKTLADYLRDRYTTQSSLGTALTSANAQVAAQNAIVTNTQNTVAQLQAMNVTLSGFAADAYQLLSKSYSGADQSTASNVVNTLAQMTADKNTFFGGGHQAGYTVTFSEGSSVELLAGGQAKFTGAAGNVSYLQASDSILELAKRIPELKAIWEQQYGIKLPTYADGGAYGGGLALVGENGPELINFHQPGQVYTSAQTAAMMSGGGSAESAALLAEVKAMRQEMQQMRAAMIATAKNTKQTSDILDQNSAGGGPLLVHVTSS